MAKLQYAVSGQVREIPLDQRLTIGRADTNQLRLTHQDVSRIHAVIVRNGSGYVIQDLDSRNGVTVNGKRTIRTELRDGDIVGIGVYRFTYCSEPAGIDETVAFQSTLPLPAPKPPPPDPTLPDGPPSIPSSPQFPSPLDVPGPAVAAHHAPTGQIFFSLDEISASGISLAAELERMRASLEASQMDHSAAAGSLPEQILESLVQGLGADRGAVVLRRPEGGLKLAVGFPRPHRHSISRVVLRATLRQRAAVLCHAPFANDHFRNSPSIQRDRTPALMAVPLVRGPETTGLLYLESGSRTDLFSPEHLPLAALTGQLLGAILGQTIGANASSSPPAQGAEPVRDEDLVEATFIGTCSAGPLWLDSKK